MCPYLVGLVHQVQLLGPIVALLLVTRGKHTLVRMLPQLYYEVSEAEFAVWSDSVRGKNVDLLLQEPVSEQH